jgi:Tol biopolymer transport system component/DNA-binding winged helix-turn-helix (wHTH) protein
MGDSSHSLHVVRFGVFEVDLQSGELRKSGLKIKLQEQPFQVLSMLLEHPGEVVHREDLRAKLWPADTFVDFEHGLNAAINKLREALGDSADNPRFVETLHRRGYRFIYPVAASPPAVSVAAASSPSPAVGAIHESPLRKRWRLALTAVVLVAGAVLVYWVARPLPQPRITAITLLTSTHHSRWWVDLFTDGTRIYYSDPIGDRWVIKQVSTAGGEPTTVPMPFRSGELLDIAPERGQLLVSDNSGGVGQPGPLWILPILGGSPRRVGDVVAFAANWFPDRQRILYARGSDIFTTRNDGTETRKLLTLPAGVVPFMVWSPDGGRVRVHLQDYDHGTATCWEFTPDGANPHPLHLGPSANRAERCGPWTPDGRYYLFRSSASIYSSTGGLYALREKDGILRRPAHAPIRLSTGAIRFGTPLPSRDGKKLFALGKIYRSELMRYDTQSRQFVPFITGISPGEVDFSRDGKWVTYVSWDNFLWRCMLDGSERRQLTFEQWGLAPVRWSPDGKRIAFVGHRAGRRLKIFVISADGGNPEQLMPGDRAETDPDWSPDGNQLLFSLGPPGLPALHLFDFRSRQISTLPNSDGLSSPRWSYDGHYIAALADQDRKLVLYDYESHKQTELARAKGGFGYLNWTRDGKTLVLLGDLTGEGASVLRFRISDDKWEQIIGPEERRKLFGDTFNWVGLTPDDSPVLVRDTSVSGIYALDWEAP